MKRYDSVTVNGLTFTVWADAPTLQDRLDSLVITDDDNERDIEASFIESARVRSLRCYSRDEKRWVARATRIVKPKAVK